MGSVGQRKLGHTPEGFGCADAPIILELLYFTTPGSCESWELCSDHGFRFHAVEPLIKVFEKILYALDRSTKLDIDVRVKFKKEVGIVRYNPSVVHVIHLVVSHQGLCLSRVPSLIRRKPVVVHYILGTELIGEGFGTFTVFHARGLVIDVFFRTNHESCLS